MKKGKGLIILLTMIFTMIMPIKTYAASSSAVALGQIPNLEQTKKDKIEKLIQREMEAGKIPGISVVIVQGDSTVYKNGFGYADVKSKKIVTADTLFELGSTSKAFTALAILQLENKGLLSLNDPIDKYIPWLKMKYKGKNEIITIEQLIHHTSGIPFNTISKIPVSESEDALEEAAKKLVGQELAYKPGEKFIYATINYDILGLIVKKVSGMSFEEYIKNSLLKPMTMDNTVLFRKEAAIKDFSKGYKVDFLKAIEYDAPMYRGNTPAGYVITNANDMEKWLKIQIGADNFSTLDKNLIAKSHVPDKSIGVGADGSAYACGWIVYDKDGEVFHAGNNPNFSSAITLIPKEKIGVAVLANMNSQYTTAISQGIMKIIQGENGDSKVSDMFLNADKIATIVLIVLIPLYLVLAYLIFNALMDIYKKNRKFQHFSIKSIFGAGLSLIMVGILEYCLFSLPGIMVGGVSFEFLKIWGPLTLNLVIWAVGIFIILMYLYILCKCFFKKEKHNLKFVKLV